jgi:hypothetical protein
MGCNAIGAKGAARQLAQPRPLQNPEPVLLINDQQANPVVLDGALEEGMRADDDVSRSRGDLLQQLRTQPRVLSPDQLHDVQVRALQ